MSDVLSSGSRGDGRGEVDGVDQDLGGSFYIQFYIDYQNGGSQSFEGFYIQFYLDYQNGGSQSFGGFYIQFYRTYQNGGRPSPDKGLRAEEEASAGD